MITYAERVCFQPAHVQLLARVETYVARVSSSWGNELRCHELARAIHIVVPDREHKMLVIDGKCGPIEHSWLLVGADVILDPYAPGRMPAVQLVDLIVGAAYRPVPSRSDIRQPIVDRLVLEMGGPPV
jgi:hypothetical protein